MGKDSVCWSWDERLKEKGRKSYARHCGLRNQMFSLSCALFNDESPLVSWKLFSYFKNCPHFHKESLRHTQHYTVKRTITVERNWFNPSKQMKTTSRLRLPITSALICWNPLYLNHTGWSHFQGKSVYSPSKSNGVAFSCMGACCVASWKFFQGELWVHIELTSVVPSLKTNNKQTNKQTKSERRGFYYS